MAIASSSVRTRSPAGVLAGQFSDKGLDEEPAMADVEKDVAGHVGQDRRIGVLHLHIQLNPESHLVDRDQLLADGQHQVVLGQVKPVEADLRAEVVGAGEAARRADALLQGGVAGHHVVDELGRHGIDEHRARQLIAAAVDHLAQVVGGQLLGLAADAGHAIHLVEEQDQAAVGERPDGLGQRAQHAKGIGPADLAAYAHIAQDLGVAGRGGGAHQPARQRVQPLLLIADQRLEVGQDRVLVRQAVDRGQLQGVDQSPVVGVIGRLQAELVAHDALERALQKARQAVFVGRALVRLVPDQVARHRGIDRALIVVGRLHRAEVHLADCKTPLPGQVAQTVEEVRLAAAVVADDHLVGRAAVLEIGGQVELVQGMQQRVVTHVEILHALDRRRAGAAKDFDDLAG